MNSSARKIYKSLAQRGDAGGTRIEIAEALGISLAAVAPHVRQLITRGLVIDSGKYRRTRDGRSSSVLIVSIHGGLPAA